MPIIKIENIEIRVTGDVQVIPVSAESTIRHTRWGAPHILAPFASPQELAALQKMLDEPEKNPTILVHRDRTGAVRTGTCKYRSVTILPDGTLNVDPRNGIR